MVTRGAIALSVSPSIRCYGEGRKQRIVPLDAFTSASLQTWLAEGGGVANGPLFQTRTGSRLSRDAMALRLATHA